MGWFDAVLDRQFFSFGGFEIITMVRVLRENQLFTVLDGSLDFFGDGEDNGLRFRRAEGAVNEVVLHVNDNQGLFHGIAYFLSLIGFLYFTRFDANVNVLSNGRNMESLDYRLGFH